MSNAISNLRTSSHTLIPPVIHNRGATACCFRILCSISNRPITISENIIGERNVIRTPQAVFCIHITFIRCIQPNKFSDFIFAAIQLADKCTMIHPYIPGWPNIDENAVVYILRKKINIPNDDIITRFIAFFAIFIVGTKHAILNPIIAVCTNQCFVVPNAGMEFFLHIQWTIYNNCQRFFPIQCRL